MSERIMYIELKTGYNDDGPAWIGKVKFSRTGRTAYFNGQAFRYTGKADYIDVETGEYYWISGVKKNGEDRHWAGLGKIMIDREIVDEYIKIVDLKNLNKNKFELIDIQDTDIQKFNEVENKKIEE